MTYRMTVPGQMVHLVFQSGQIDVTVGDQCWLTFKDGVFERRWRTVRHSTDMFVLCDGCSAVLPSFKITNPAWTDDQQRS